ncbi:hypothetical protein GCM10027610_139540 [Dactylosporangium cerinum]
MRTFPTPPRYDLAGTLQGLALIHGDPTLSVGAREGWFATRTPSGAGTLHLALSGSSLVATAYGPGADWLLDRADAVAGLRDDVTGFAELARQHPLVHRLAREHSGLRIGATGRVFHHLVPAVLGQKVTGKEARDGYVRLLRHFSTDPAPGPNPRLRLPPSRPRSPPRPTGSSTRSASNRNAPTRCAGSPPRRAAWNAAPRPPRPPPAC